MHVYFTQINHEGIIISEETDVNHDSLIHLVSKSSLSICGRTPLRTLDLRKATPPGENVTLSASLERRSDET